MGQKSIGAFIAALRKANGLTQKDLAEKLNVSDKTVSRWERDEGTPDLSLIPVIAEIFDVTCDELLRGERKAPDERTLEKEAGNATARRTKQRQRLLASSLTQFKNHSYIAMGISLAGLAAAMILNLGLLSAIIGFSVALIFLIAGFVCQLIFLNNAFAAVAGIDEDMDLYNYKRNIVRKGERCFGLDVFILGLILPLLTLDAYLGLDAGSWLTFGMLSSAILTIVYIVICWAVNAFLVKRSILRMDRESEAHYWKKHRLQRKYGVRLCIILAITFFVQAGINVAGETTFASGTVFEDYDSFVAYMEEISDNSSDSDNLEVITGSSESENSETVLIYQANATDGDEIYFDENGNPVSEDYVNSLYPDIIYGEALTDNEGNLLCKWVCENENVSVRYGEASSGYLPITVYDEQSLTHANVVIYWINIAFIAVYLGAIVTTVIIYRKKREE